MPPSTLPALVALLSLGLGSVRSGGREELPLAPVRTIERAEHFLLEQPAPASSPRAPGGGPPRRPAPALVEWRRSRQPDGLSLELQVHFLESGISTYHVEQLSAGRTRLVYRELVPRSGRTLLVEWTRGATALRCTEWGVGGRLVEELDAGQGAVFPLYLAELLRAGHSTEGAQKVLDPLARNLEAQWIRTSYGPDGESGFLRSAEVRREDGSLAVRYDFRGSELVGIQWQEGGWRARRISPEDFERRLRASRIPVRVPAEAGGAVKDL